jgi:hypothetical protein
MGREEEMVSRKRREAGWGKGLGSNYKRDDKRNEYRRRKEKKCKNTCSYA